MALASRPGLSDIASPPGKATRGSHGMFLSSIISWVSVSLFGFVCFGVHGYTVNENIKNTLLIYKLVLPFRN